MADHEWTGRQKMKATNGSRYKYKGYRAFRLMADLYAALFPGQAEIDGGSRKAGHIFGTPRTCSGRDDILALRRLEENIELLMILHLFPLFHVKVGTPEEPGDYNIDGTSEVDFVRNDIEQMPKEGFLVTDGRVEIKAVGAEGEALDYDSIVKHYKQRVFVGLGVAGVDMGEGDTANRSTAETVSQNLKDYVKADLDWFTGQVQMLMIREFFQEAPFELSVQNAVADVHIEFPEIDVDGMIKMENHSLNLYNSHLLDEDEARGRLRRQPYTEKQRAKTHYRQHVLDLALKTAKAKAEYAAEFAPAETKATPQHMAPKTKEQPTNQHKKNLDPHKARSSRNPQYFRPLYDLLMEMRGDLDKNGKLVSDEWRLRAPKLIYAYFNEISGEKSENVYTNQARVGLDQIRDRLVVLIPETYDPDLVSVVLRDAQEDLGDLGIEVIDDGQSSSERTTRSEESDSSGNQDGAVGTGTSVSEGRECVQVPEGNSSSGNQGPTGEGVSQSN